MGEILKKSSDDFKNNSTKDTWGGVATVSCDVLAEIETELNKLRHHEATTVGLYAIDFDPKELIKRFVDSQSGATRLLVEDVEDLVEDWAKFLNDKNIGKNPFFLINCA